MFGTLTETIRPRDTAGELLERLSVAGAELLVRTLDAIEDGTIAAVPQPADGVSHAPRLLPADARVDWTRPAYVVDRLVRGCTPAPGAWTTLPDGARVQFCGPPATRRHWAMAIRRHRRLDLPLDAYDTGPLTGEKEPELPDAGAEPIAFLRAAIAARKTILISGGTSTGKTTLTNALLAEVAKTADRVVIIGNEAQVEPIEGMRGSIERWDTDEPSTRGIGGEERMRLIREDIQQRVDGLVSELHD